MKYRVKQRVIDAKISEINSRKQQAEIIRTAALAIPEIGAAQKEYARLTFDSILKGKDLSSFDIEIAENRYLAALKKYGYDEKSFSAEPLCPICKDTGLVDGKLCKCVKSAYVLELSKECDLNRRAPFSFADNDPPTSDAAQAAALNNLYSAMSEYVDKYPAVKTFTWVFCGGTGTGKTCLASSMVRKSVLEYGRSALLLSSFELGKLFLSYHLAPLKDKDSVLHDVLTADLIVIDDLGTEPMLKNVSINYLLLLIEERTSARLTTVITTNLSPDDLLDRYGERVFSRLNDKRHAQIKRIPGKDLR